MSKSLNFFSERKWCSGSTSVSEAEGGGSIPLFLDLVKKRCKNLHFFCFVVIIGEYIFYSFMVKVMVTVDPTMQNQTTTSFSDPAQRSFPNDEFDLGITQENPIQEQVISVSSVEPASVSETNASFDFSLDLPDSYSQVEEPAPIQTNAVATEASSVPQEELPVASSQDVIPSDESAVSSFVGESSL